MRLRRIHRQIPLAFHDRCGHSESVPRPRTNLKVSAQQLAKLKRLLAATTDRDDRKKLQVLVAAASGRHTLAQLARKVRCAPSTVPLWLKRFRKGGWEALRVRNSPPGRTSPLDRPKVRAKLLPGLRDRRWRSTVEVSAWLKNEYNIQLAPKSVQRRLKAMGWDLRPPKPMSVTWTKASRAKTAARQREHQTDYEVLSYDMGVQAAATFIRSMMRSQPGKETGDGSEPRPIDEHLEIIFELLEKGECSLAQAGRFVDAVREEWAQERVSG